LIRPALAACVAELRELPSILPPLGRHTDPELEVHLATEELLDPEAGARADPLEHLAGFADEDPLLPGPLDPDGRIDVHRARALRRLDEAIDRDGDGVRYLGLGGAEDLLAHILG